jgi:hypothetical protein
MSILRITIIGALIFGNFWASAQVSGIYTVNSQGSGTNNYTSLQSALTSLSNSGVSGPVTINVAPGLYQGQFFLDSVAGTSEVNRIIIQKDTSLTGDVRIFSGIIGGWALKLTSVRHLKLQGCILESSGNSEIVQYNGRCGDLEFIHNIFRSRGPIAGSGISHSSTSTSKIISNVRVINNVFDSLSVGIELFGGGGNVTAFDSAIVEDNVFTHIGAYGIILEGANHQEVNRNHIDSEIFGLRSFNCLSAVVKENVVHANYSLHLSQVWSPYHPWTFLPINVNISNNEIQSTARGIVLSGRLDTTLDDYSNIVISKNLIHMEGMAVLGIEIDNLVCPSTQHGSVVNNMIDCNFNPPSWGSYYPPKGITISKCIGIDVFHNSVLMQGVNTSSCFYMDYNSTNFGLTTQDIAIRNNLFINRGGGFVIEFSNNSADLAGFTINNNCYQTTGTNFIRLGSKYYQNFTQWTSNSLFPPYPSGINPDANSYTVNPIFYSNSNLHVQDASANAKGGSNMGVLDDFDSDIRPAISPDAGADEYTPMTCYIRKDLHGTLVEDTSFTATWINTNLCISNQVQWREIGNAAWMDTIVSGNQVSIGGLTPNTHYEFRVRAVCSVGDTSLWAEWCPVRTKICPTYQACAYFVYMGVTNGKNWNGNRLIFSIDSSEVYTTQKLGTTYGIESDTIHFCSFENVQVNLLRGNYSEQIEFWIVDSFGDTVLQYNTSNNSLPLNYFFGSFSTDCRSPSQLLVTVDMNKETISPQGVHVMGSFQNWDPSTTAMYDTNGDGIFSYTISGRMGDTVDYTFVNGNTVSNAETIPNSCASYTTNARGVILSSTFLQADSVCFNQCSVCRTSVTFRVDMAWEIANSSLANQLYIVNSESGWNLNQDIMTDADSDGVYELTLNLTPGTDFWYLFVNGLDWLDAENSSQLSNCGQPNGNGGFIRYLTIPSEDSVLAAVCFSKCYECSTALDESISDFTYGPNPSFGELKMERTLIDGEIHVEVYNALGVKAYETTWRNGAPQIDIQCTTWPSGNYWIYIESDYQRNLLPFILIHP